jgi:hypothetical protein
VASPALFFWGVQRRDGRKIKQEKVPELKSYLPKLPFFNIK